MGSLVLDKTSSLCKLLATDIAMVLFLFTVDSLVRDKAPLLCIFGMKIQTLSTKPCLTLFTSMFVDLNARITSMSPKLTGKSVGLLTKVISLHVGQQ